MADENITQIPAPRVDFIDPRTGLLSRQWYRFFLSLFNLTAGNANSTSISDLQVGPPQPASNDVGTYFQDAVLTPAPDTAELKQQIDAIDQEVGLLPSFSSLNSGAYFSIVGPPTAGSVPYGNGNSLVFSPTYISVTPGVGNVTIAAPSTSGVGLTVTGLSGFYTQYIENPGQAGLRLNTTGSTGIYTSYAQAGTIGAYIGVGSSVITGAASTDLGITSNGGNIYFGRSAGSAIAMQIANAGNVTIREPASGYSLTVSGTANATFTDGTGNYGIQMAAGAAYVGTTSNHSTTLRTNNTDRVVMNNVGNVTVNAPFSGNALTVVGLTGAATYASTNTTSGAGSEYHYQATNGTDSSFNILLSQVGAASKYAHLFTATNTPLYLGTNSTIRATVAADGSVVIGAPTGGSMGSGTINATNLYVNGVAVSTGGGGSFTGGTLTSQLILAAGTASAGTAPMEFQSGTVNTTAEAGALEYDGAVFYATPNTTSGRGYTPSVHIFRLAANGTAFGPAIGNFFGANSAINLVGGGVYEIEVHCYFTKTTAGTVVVTATTSLAPVNLSGVIQTGVITGGTATGAAQQIALFNSTATGAAFGATGSLTTAVNHYMKISLIVEANASASNLRINFTSSAGTVTPLRTSYYKVTRLPAGNTGLYAA